MSGDVMEIGKWLAGQSDRALFILALAVGGWLFTRVLRRSESQTDQLVTQLNENRAAHQDRMEKLNKQVFENSERVASVVATNTAMMERTNRVLEKVEQKL